MSFKLRKINNEDVKPLKLDKDKDTRLAKGHKLFSRLTPTVALIAQRETGKTTTIAHILDKCAGRETAVVFFVSTFWSDDTYKAIRKQLKKKKIVWQAFDKILVDGVDKLDQLNRMLKLKHKDDDESDEEPEPKNLLADDDETEVIIRKKYKTPEYIVILDDISSEMRKPSVVTAIKDMRHQKAMLICSTQYIKDIDVQERRNIQNWIVFNGEPDSTIEVIQYDSVPNFDLIPLYKFATDSKHSFLYIEKKGKDTEFRKNFTQVIETNNF
jgi:hypothetical protein